MKCSLNFLGQLFFKKVHKLEPDSFFKQNTINLQFILIWPIKRSSASVANDTGDSGDN